MINVWLAIEKSNWQAFRNNFRMKNDPSGALDADGNPVQIPRRKDFSKRMMKFLRRHTHGHWKAPTITVNGTDYEFRVLNLYISGDTVGAHQDPQEDDPKLWELRRIRQILPGREFILGAWDTKTGVQYGQTLVPATYDVNGDELTPETITGDAVYPINNVRVRRFLPDDVTSDEDGNEISRTPASAFKQCNKLQGHPDRRV